MSETLRLLGETFTPEVKAQLVKTLQRSYTSNADCYYPEYGHDYAVFGFMVYKTNVHFLCELSITENWLKILSRSPGFLMQVGRYKVATYKVGSSFDVDPKTAFPNNRVGAPNLAQANQAQMMLPFETIVVGAGDDSNCTHVIIAHSGNPDEGLLQVFAGVPLQYNEKRQITAWSTIFHIWNKGENDFGTIAVAPPNDEPKAPIEKAAPLELTLKSDAKKTKEKS